MTKTVPVTLLAVSLTVLSSATAMAEKVNFAGKMIELVAPPGQCILDKKNAYDARLLSLVAGALGGRNTLLAMYADCKEYKQWHSGKIKTLNNISQYQAPNAYVTRNLKGPPAKIISRLCTSMRAVGKAQVDKITKNVNRNIAKLATGMKINEMRSLGVLDEDATACYSGLLQSIRTELGTMKIIANVYAITVLDGQLLFYYLLSPYKGPQTVQDLLERQKTNVTAFLAVNEKKK